MMQLSSRLVLVIVATGAILAILLHGAVDWGSCKCPFTTQNAVDTDLAGKQSNSRGSPDNQFLTEQINNILRSLNEGKTELVLPPLDPLVLESMIIKEGPNMLPIDLNLRNITIRGLSKLHVTDAKNNWKKLEIIYFLDKLEIEGNYDLKANLMVLPISVSGPCAFIYENMTVTLTADLNQVINEDKTFLQVENIAVLNDPQNFTMNIKNLISEAEEFDSIMNKFLNKNFKELIAETMSKAHEELYVGIANMILTQIPIDTSNQQTTKQE